MEKDKYMFTRDWFSHNINIWKKILAQFKIEKVLEIGCFEGKATTWLLQNISTIQQYHVIDTFKGSKNESGMRNMNLNNIYDYFKHNIIEWQDKVIIHKGESQNILPTLNNTFDFIYIDASHKADDVFVDGYWANKLLNKNGLIIFDDYEWKDIENLSIINSPKYGINCWYDLYKNSYNILFLGYQAAFIKKGS